MDAATRAALNEAENLLVDETGRDALAALDEDAAIGLETRIRRARDKYVSQYRRGAATRVAARGGRGRARPENANALRKAEAFERALSRVSRRVSALARQSAAALRAERLEQARAARRRDWPGDGEMVPRQGRREPQGSPPPSAARTGERALRNPASERGRAQALAAGARQQAMRDTKRAAARQESSPE
jgi:hypothetical protein